MGQRTFRGQLTNSLINEYSKKDRENQIPDENLKGSCYKSLDVNYVFNLADPLENVSDLSKLKHGIINSIMGGKYKIRNLNLDIRTPLGKNEVYQNMNLNILFGSNFKRDIEKLFIRIIDKENKLQDNRRIISQVLDFLVFKSKQTVLVNNKFVYHILPNFGEHSIVLTYKGETTILSEAARKEATQGSLKNQIGEFPDQIKIEGALNPQLNKESEPIDDRSFILNLLTDFINHSFSTISGSFVSLQKCKLAITKSVPSKVNNIILPIIDLSTIIKNNERYNLASFFDFISSKFKYISVEFKINYGNFSFADFILRYEDQIKRSEYTIMNFTFEEHALQFPGVKQLLKINKLDNIAVTEHVFRKVKNEITGLNDYEDKYKYVYYNRKQAEQIYSTLFIVDRNPKLRKLKHKKPILDNLLEFKLGFGYRDKLFTEGEVDFSTHTVRNKRLMQLDINHNTFMLQGGDN